MGFYSALEDCVWGFSSGDTIKKYLGAAMSALWKTPSIPFQYLCSLHLPDPRDPQVTVCNVHLQIATYCCLNHICHKSNLVKKI